MIFTPVVYTKGIRPATNLLQLSPFMEMLRDLRGTTANPGKPGKGAVKHTRPRTSVTVVLVVGILISQ